MKRYLKFPAVLLTALCLSLVFVACDDDDNDVAPSQNIVQIASDNPEYSILVEALTKAGLVGTLEGTGPYTVFAPTDDAFTALLNDLGLTSLEDLSAEELRPILLYHVIGAEVFSGNLSTGYVSTASNSGPGLTNLSMYIEVSNGVKINNDVNVTAADIDATNGVIHQVDKVILPPDIVDLAVQNGGFTSLVGALGTATGDLVTVLTGDGPFTVFAPTDEAFAAISDVVAGLSPEDLSGVLTYHVVSGNVRSSDLSDDMTVATLNGDITIDLSNGPQIRDAAGNTVDIILTDIQGTNGVIHVIDAVLLK